MKALQKTAPEFGVELRDVALPGPPGPGEVLIEVEAAGICGSDVHIYEWTSGYEHVVPALPLTLGHEFTGRVAGIGDAVTDLAPGTGVTVRPSVACGDCAECRARNFDTCLARQSIGITRPGAFAQWVVVPAMNCLPLPDNVDGILGAITEPMTIGARAVEVGEVSPGDRVLIMGPGPIGQSIAVMAREAGAAEIIVMGKDDTSRLNCLHALGFDRTIDLAEGDFESKMKRHMGTDKFDIVFEATGVPDTLSMGLSVLRRFGIMVTCAIHAVPAAIDVTPFVRQQQQLRGSAGGTAQTWNRVLEVLASKSDQLRAMISHRLPLERAIEGFEFARSKTASKVVIVPNG